MNSFLLYVDKEWNGGAAYYDSVSITQDLGLRTLFMASAKDIVMDNERVVAVKQEDNYIHESVKKVMMTPVKTKEEMYYRQEILKDFIANEWMVVEIYELMTRMINVWDRLGRKSKSQSQSASKAATLIRDIQVLELFTDTLAKLKRILSKGKIDMKSAGLSSLYKRLNAEFTDEMEDRLKNIIHDISFYTDISEEEKVRNRPTIGVPRIVMECGIDDGLKFSSIKLQKVQTIVKKLRNPNGAISKIQDYVTGMTPGSILLQKDVALKDDAAELEFQAVNYIVACCMEYMSNFYTFFDQLHFQIAFYKGAVTLKHHMDRFKVAYCFPRVCEKNELKFTDLKEFVMCMEQRVETIGNTCDIDKKMLLIVTGANQGGKSTFLRSLGIAQIMMQCGMPVAAKEYKSSIFTGFFTHFTRREDSAMNSGRLDDELKRMNQIVEHIDDSSVVLLNESFATTTEKEGSVIAYDIIKALVEAGVKILTVTHLLSFAQKIYDETQENEDSIVEFLSAERLENGKRTFKMIQHAPELTSFGLDLYEDIVEKRGIEK